MSVYPPPNTISVFNPDDYDTHSGSTPPPSGTTTDDYDHSQFIHSAGGIMTGQLTVPTLAFSNGSIQTTAFSSEKNQKLLGFAYDSVSGTYTIGKLKVNEITFQNDTYGATEPQTNNFFIIRQAAN